MVYMMSKCEFVCVDNESVMRTDRKLLYLIEQLYEVSPILYFFVFNFPKSGMDDL